MTGRRLSRQIELSGRIVLVTGGARGIGYAVAELAIQCGAQVAICDLDDEEVAGAAHRLGYDTLGLAVDVINEDDCETTIRKVVERFGRIDVLLNNAGVFEDLRSTFKQDLVEWRRVIDVNLQGTFLMARAAANSMSASRIQGSIINIASVAGLVGFPASNAYGVSKAAVVMLTKTLATDLASRGIRVNAVAPGFIHTPMTATLAKDLGAPSGIFERRIPMGRFGDPQDIARAAVFLASDWGSYITGAILPVDGGWCAFGGPGNASALDPKR
jgi:NAD(P)-dependent dehydrogenase (short-subunit alcohol dehydrogenase family)